MRITWMLVFLLAPILVGASQAGPMGGASPSVSKRQSLESRMQAPDPGWIPRTSRGSEKLLSLHRSRIARALSSGSQAISPPNVRANDPTVDLPEDTQSQVAIAAWQNFVVVIWQDGRLDDTGELPYMLIGYAYSCDKGATFVDGGYMPHTLPDDSAYDGELTVDGQGNFYVALNLVRGVDPASPLGYSLDTQAVWKGRFTGCDFAWDPPIIAVQQPAGTNQYFSYPHIVADPYDNAVYVAYARYLIGDPPGGNSSQIEVVASTDGVATWVAPQVVEVPRPGYSPNHPRLAVGPDHEVYMVWTDNELAFMWCDRNNLAPLHRVRFSRSLDHGVSWRSPSVVAEQYTNRFTSGPGDYRGFDTQFSSIAVDRSDGPAMGTVYVAWHESGQWIRRPALSDTAREEAEPTNDDPSGAGELVPGGAATGSAKHYMDIDHWKMDLQAGDNIDILLEPQDWACPGAPSAYGFYIRLFAAPKDLSARPDSLLASSELFGTASRIVFTCHRTGTYYLRARMLVPDSVDVRYTISTRLLDFLEPTTSAPARDERDIVLVRSINQGTSWSSKNLVNRDSPPGYTEILPFMAVDDTGRLAIFWYDRRETEAPNAGVSQAQLTDIYMAQSVDGGASFSEGRRVTDESSAFASFGFINSIGDFASAFANGREIYAAWADGRLSNTETSGIDAYIGRVVWPRVQTNVASIRFPTITEGDSTSRGIILANPGSAPLQVTSLSLPFTDMDVTPSPPFEVPVDGEVVLRFEFHPISSRDSSGVIQIGSSDPFTPVRPLAVSARVRRLGFQIVSEEFFRDSVVAQGQDVPVIVVMDDSVNVDSVSVHYREGGEATFSNLPLELINPGVLGARYRGFVPTAAVGARGLEFYVAARNGAAAFFSPTPFAPVRFDVRVANLSLPYQAPEAYHMISVPLDFNKAVLMSLFGDDLGPTDPMRWRMFELESSTPEATQYRELDSEDPTLLLLGSAYWLITRSGIELDTSPGIGVSTSTGSSYTLMLDQTWNMIASPFDFPVAWSAVRAGGVLTGDQNAVGSPMHWNPAAKTYECATALAPFEGYFVSRIGDAGIKLEIPPVEAPSSPTQARSTVCTTGVEGGWELKIGVSSGEWADAAYAGVGPGGRSEWDRMDGYHPPMMPGGGVSLASSHPDWGDRRGLYYRDIREPLPSVSSSAGVGHCWMLDVAVASPERRPWADVTLWVEGVDQVPDGLQVTLVDERLGRRVDLRAERSYTFVSEDASQRPAAAGPRFRLLVGDAAFVDHGLRSTNRVVTAGVLQSAPNPFRSDARIRYGVGAQAKSELQIFDVSGRLLKTLASGVQGPGLYEVVWSGDTDGGERVGPGLYFARLTAPGLSETEKILRIR